MVREIRVPTTVHVRGLIGGVATSQAVAILDLEERFVRDSCGRILGLPIFLSRCIVARCPVGWSRVPEDSSSQRTRSSLRGTMASSTAPSVPYPARNDAPDRARGHGIGAHAMSHDPVAPAQDRRSAHPQFPHRAGPVLERLSGPSAVLTTGPSAYGRIDPLPLLLSLHTFPGPAPARTARPLVEIRTANGHRPAQTGSGHTSCRSFPTTENPKSPIDNKELGRTTKHARSCNVAAGRLVVNSAVRRRSTV